MCSPPSFGAAAKDHHRLFYNDAGFLLALAIADGALFGYESLAGVQEQRIPDGDNELILTMFVLYQSDRNFAPLCRDRLTKALCSHRRGQNRNAAFLIQELR